MHKQLLPFIFTFLLLFTTGCASDMSTQPTVNADGSVSIGNMLIVSDFDSDFQLIDNKDALSADGLYYAAWASGEAVDFENSDGDIVDLYPAQIYLLLADGTNTDAAANNCDRWLTSARENYQATDDKTVIIHDVTWQFLNYTCTSDTNPYAKGASAFAVVSNYAVCVELTGQDSFEGDCETILTQFLNALTFTVD